MIKIMNTDINLLTEAEQIELIKKDPYLIQNIKNPTEAVQMEAIKKSPYLIIFIKNPTEKVKIEAFKLYRFDDVIYICIHNFNH